MKKKLALIVISLDLCFPNGGFSGGGHKVTKNLILGLINSGNFDIDIYCQKGINDVTIDGINSIKTLNSKNFVSKLKTQLEKNNYDYILSSDILLPFANNLIHSNSSKHKSKNGKNKLMQFILKLYNARKIKRQENNLPKNKAIFTVSKDLKKDYVYNYSLDESKVFVSYPAVDNAIEYNFPEQKNVFTIGSIVGGGLNKGGYLLLLALCSLPKNCKIKAKFIFPKIKKAFFFKTFVKILGLQKNVEILSRQKDMSAYYKTLDCYILPSLNEAFGLVVTEAALNYKPSIVSSTTGASELIQDKVNGFVFDREHSPLKNLKKKLIEVEKMYFEDYNKFVQISKSAHCIVEKLDWQQFTDTIIENMIGEK